MDEKVLMVFINQIWRKAESAKQADVVLNQLGLILERQNVDASLLELVKKARGLGLQAIHRDTDFTKEELLVMYRRESERKARESMAQRGGRC